MDQILTTDNNLINDDSDSKSNAVVNSSDESFVRSFPNTVHEFNNENHNEENKAAENSLENLETENLPSFGENDVSSTSLTEGEVIPNGDDSSIVRESGSTCDAGEDSEKKTANSIDAEADISNSQQSVFGGCTLDKNETNSSVELPSASDETPEPMLPSTADNICADSSIELNNDANDVSKIQNSCDSHISESNVTSDEKASSDRKNNFLPTIVEIRGGCATVPQKSSDRISTLLHDDVTSSTPSVTPALNIVSVLGGLKDLNTSNEIGKIDVKSNSEEASNQVVHIISDCEDDNRAISNKCLEDALNTDITIKQEPHDSVSDDDCVYMGTENASSTFTSEIVIKEEKTSNIEVEDPEVICIETTSKIPLPIPIKTESNIEAETQQNASTTEKFTAKKRLTRSSSSRSDDCVVLSSGSDRDSVPETRNRFRLAKSAAYSTAGYTCHLCNTVFQEHELLNEHMILHRNNSLIEAKVQSRSKMPKIKTFTCDICQKRLSTSQSLQQHEMIHKNEKPYSCLICKKDFRHLSNYRMHLQKHKAEQRRRGGAKMAQKSGEEKLDKSVVRGVDFGRLVGPLFMKESLLHQKTREPDTTSGKTGCNTSATVATSAAVPQKGAFTSLAPATKEAQQRQPRLSFDQPTFKTKENSTISTVVSNPSKQIPPFACYTTAVASSSAVIIRRRDPSPDSKSDDECVAVKSFNNIESVVMNASKIIVRLDNLDANVLKRKLQTPDISIDQGPKKCRIMLSPIAEKRNVKLDEIENIPMDTDVGDVDSSAAECTEDEDHFDGGTADNEHEDEPADGSSLPSHGRLTDNELFELLNDDRDTYAVSTISAVSATSSSSCQTALPEYSKAENAIQNVAATPATKRSNVIFVEASAAYETSGCDGDFESALDDDLDDAFDAAFHKVTVRRLALLRKRAAENGGKVESRYLLGPLFWRKALRRAKKRTIEASHAAATTVTGNGSTSVDSVTGNNDSSNYYNPLKTWTGFRRYGGRSRFDDRRTNDPTKLQPRAESKFKCLLERARMMNDLNVLNLAGPLFWRRTLQLAGVRRGEDLRTFMNDGALTLEGVEFVDDDGKPYDFAAELVDALQQQQQKMICAQPTLSPSSGRVPAAGALTSGSDDWPYRAQLPADERLSSSSLTSGDVAANDVTQPPDQVRQSPPSAQCVQQQLSSSDTIVAQHTSHEKTDSILYDSLTKPKDSQQLQQQQHQLQQSIKSDSLPPSMADATSLFVATNGTVVAESSLASPVKTTELLENCELTEGLNHKYSHSVIEGAGTLPLENESGVAKLAAIDSSGSIVLNVDGGGGLQLIPANSDQVALAEAGQNFVLVSDETGAMQYMVNVPSEQYANFELIGGGAEQLAYAIQFDGGNYAAVQFVQDGAGVHLQHSDKEGSKETKLQVDSKAAATAFLVSNSGTPATAVVSDPNHIGKELSDFLNLDYGTLIKSGTTDQSTS